MRPLVSLLAAAMLFAAVGEAAAHAALVTSDPADGAILDEAPRRLVLTFDEPVTPIILKLTDPKGQPVDLAAGQVTGAAIVITPPPLSDGTSVLSWRVISADGHPVAGSVVFSVGRETAIAPTPTAGNIWTRTGLWLTRIALYALLAFGVGGVFFRHWIAPEPPPETETRWPLVAFIGWGICTALLALGFHGLDVLALGPSAFMAGKVWRAAFSTSYALTIAAIAVALLAALGALNRTGRVARILSLAALALAAAAPALSGHASTAAPQFLTRPIVALHVGAVIFWSGALVPLATLIGTGNRLAIRALLRFGRAIPYALIPLLVSGATLATIQIERIDAARSTDYGRLLLAKIAVVILLLAIAAWNRFHLTARVAGGDIAGARSLLHAIGAEVLLVLVIFAIVAGWRFTPPPRALHAAEALHLHLHGSKLVADMSLRPVRSGPVTISLSLMSGDFQPLEAQEVAVVLASPETGIEPIRRQATRTAGGDWRLETTLPAATAWTIRIAALVSDFDEVTVEGDFRVARAPP
jgi:copper transport protein